jgi:hypothetical protein
VPGGGGGPIIGPAEARAALMVTVIAGGAQAASLPTILDPKVGGGGGGPIGAAEARAALTVTVIAGGA